MDLKDSRGIAYGGVPYSTNVNKFGYNGATAAADGIWTPSTAFPLPSALSAGVITLVSGDAKDDGDPAGVGVRTIRVSGLDANWEEQTEDFTLNGTTNVVSTSTWLRVNRMFALTAGSENDNAGAITCTLGGTTIAQIAAGRNQTEQAWYTVPVNKVFVLEHVYLEYARNANAARTVQADVKTSVSAGSNVMLPKVTMSAGSSGTSSRSRKPSPPILIPEKTDVQLICTAITAGEEVHGGFDGTLIDNG